MGAAALASAPAAAAAFVGGLSAWPAGPTGGACLLLALLGAVVLGTCCCCCGLAWGLVLASVAPAADGPLAREVASAAVAAAQRATRRRLALYSEPVHG